MRESSAASELPNPERPSIRSRNHLAMTIVFKSAVNRAIFAVLVLLLTACAPAIDHARDPSTLLSAMRKTPGGKWFYDQEILDNAERVCANQDDTTLADELTAYGFTPAQVAVLLEESPGYCGKTKHTPSHTS